MTKDEALRLAIESLCCVRDMVGHPDNLEYIDHQVAKIEAALEAKDEPVEFFDWYDNAHWGNEDFKEGCHRSWNAAIKYTTPPQRTWVGLTDEEIEVIEVLRAPPVHPDFVDCDDWVEFARAIENKLRELNT